MSAALLIRDDDLAVSFDAATGGIRQLSHRATGDWLRLDAAGGLFVLEVPRGGDRTVVIATSGQQLSGTEVAAGGRSVRLTWRELRTSTGERLAGQIVVDAAVSAGALDLAMSFAVDDAPVEAVRFPSLAGIDPSPRELEYRGVDYSTGTRVRLLPVFDNNSPYWGTTFPDHASGNLRPEVIGNPTSPFVVLSGASGGLAVLPSPPTLEFIGWRTSLVPGYADSLSRTAASDATVLLEAVHFPPEGEGRRDLPPMRVAGFAGGWEEGIEPYRRMQGPTQVSGAPWLAEPRSWLQVQLMSTEGEPRYDFDDLVSIIEECAAAGIGAVQITGWNEGGQDGLVPVHRPARKLGGESGLRRALERARELDVKAVLYVKYVWVEKPGPYWAELENMVARDPNGQPYAQPGPVYHSSRKRYGVNTPWYVPLCFGVAELRARFAEEVAEMAEWGADGILADESLYHGRSLLCFADGHGHEPGAGAFLWDRAFIEDIRSALGERSGSFVLAGEGCYDDQFEHYDLSYFRSASPSHVPLGRMLRPSARIVTALTGFDDRNMVNQSLVYGYGLSFEPFHFKGRPGDMPDTVAYGTAVDALRQELSEWLWNGALLSTPGVTVQSIDPAVPEPAFAVWRNEGGRRCLVVANYGGEPAEFAVDGLDIAESIAVGGEPAADITARGVRIGGRSAAILLETGGSQTSDSER